MKTNLKIACFGEVLWDVFPTYKMIGGAPFNVAARLYSLSNDVCLVSKIGKDADGEEIMAYMQSKGINTEHVQVDEKLKTGDVTVMLDDKGSASYTIAFPRAWDAIGCTDRVKEEIARSDAFVFGSLSARNHISKNTLYELIACANYTVFDVNLRAPHYTKESILALMSKADFIKLNDDELMETMKYMGKIPDTLEQNIMYISQMTSTPHICVTLGKEGAVLLYNEEFYHHKGYEVKVIDTVGAGDSFLASLIHHLLRKAPPGEAIDFACAVGALVAQKKGANPDITMEEVCLLMKS